MIAYLRGKVFASMGDKYVIITDSGIGYEVFSTSELNEGDEIEVFTTTITRDTGSELFAFENMSKKIIFELFLQVNGVGPKSAFSIVKNLGVTKSIEAILNDDDTVFKSISGIGAKTSKQIILDLKSKIEKDPSLGGKITLNSFLGAESNMKDKKQIPSNLLLELRQVLKSLGYKDQEIQKKFSRYNYKSGAKTDEIIKELIMM